MRAIYSTEIYEADFSYPLSKEKSHHLINVLRVKAGDNILALNGKGLASELVVREVHKREVVIYCQNVRLLPHTKMHIDLLVCKVKKEAMDMVVKAAVELGVVKLIIGESEYSQNYPINESRIEKLIISALEQSNNPYKLDISVKSLTEVKYSDYDAVVCFSSLEQTNESSLKIEAGVKVLVVIGPEGGFSQEEESFLAGCGSTLLNIKTPIMRTQTAVSCAVGYILGLDSINS